MFSSTACRGAYLTVHGGEGTRHTEEGCRGVDRRPFTSSGGRATSSDDKRSDRSRRYAKW